MNVPERLRTISVLVAESQDLTSAVTLDDPPATISPTVKSPLPDPIAKLTVIALAKADSISSIAAIPVSIFSSLYSKSSH